ncbi:sigma-70 family RNA polymerase sigma factor [Frigoriglobus tundricola]|uniref:Uncharacterized protein n=1 Tax=Frigoriglobus tundricola TaxID=2774151 RepID=A0A6M5YV88_9BACT|nr:sigma-70 family RNA polymerase sigma factor [Frigoriglobus tundricola]QJW97384.1 hypothetical protein FTUN_4958 [Frigoriglobus tundricola]
MATKETSDVVRLLHRLSGEQPGAEPSDGQLLQQFVSGRDEAAFSTILLRHGPLVLGVCRQILRDTHAAEDAFQATFLVLARKAGTIRDRASVAAWLHRVAVNIARSARTDTTRRRTHESQAATMSPTYSAEDVPPPDWLAWVHEEVDRLPEKYRLPVVLCYLEGRTHEAAAAQLGWPLGSVKGRLARARNLLRSRLARRGLALTAAVLGSALSADATAAPVRPALLELTARAAVAFGPGEFVADTPSAAHALAEGALRAMTATRVSSLVVPVLVLALVGAGAAFAWSGTEPVLPGGSIGGTVKVGNVAPLAAPAPVPQEDKAAKELETRVAPVRTKAVKYLKDTQDKNGSWEAVGQTELAGLKGGTTALAALALLEAGVPANDPAVAKAVEYLLTLKADKTYVVSLKTQVLARADAKKHAKEIQAGADWLMENAIVKDKKLQGWSYPGNAIADNSNTHFAVTGLHAAAQAGAKVDAEIWPKLRAYYTDTQMNTGGWPYHNAGAQSASDTMTINGLLALTLAAKHDNPAKGPDPAFEKGMAFLLDNDLPAVRGKSLFVTWMSVAELGRALGTSEFKSGKRACAWYREGVEKMLKTQQENGSLKDAKFPGGLDAGHPVISTACGLYVLGPPKK